MATQCGASHVMALDIVPSHFETGRELAEKFGCADRVTFGTQVPESFIPEIVVSISAFEHFADPAAELRRMSKLLPPGGLVVISFAER